jgi:hypothetical protein
MLLFCSTGFAQELEPPAEQKTEEIGSLGYGTSDSNELDQSALTQRVDELTEVVNTHTDQITELDKRLTALEKQEKPTLAATGLLQRSSLSSKLNPVGKVRSWGAPVLSSGGGSTGNLSRSLSSSNLLSRVVSVSEPVVTSVRYGQPTVTSVQVSEPIRYEATPAPQPVIQQPVIQRPVIVQQPQIVRSAPIVMASLPAAPAPVERRQTVRMPVTRVTTQNVRYEAAPSNCPGGVCLVNRPGLGGGLLRRVFRP